MPHLRNVLLPSLVTLLFATAARPCGPDFPSAIFVTTTGPDGNYASYVDGHLGVPQPEYRTRHLVIAYDYLTQRPLSSDERKQAIATNQHFADPWQDEDAAEKSAPPSGASQWLAARTPFGQLDQDDPASQPISHSVPGGNYDTFDNCLNDAFVNAAHTLQARIANYGTKDPSVIDWVRAQDAVFSNCSDGKPTQFYGPGTPPPPPPPHAPNPAPANAPLWLRQDRAYQLAAAKFYALDFDAAIAGFRSIAADTASPWSPISRYLIARSYIRKAAFIPAPAYPKTTDNPTPAEVAATNDAGMKQQSAYDVARKQILALAQHELIAIRSDPQAKPEQHAAEELLDYVNLRLQPEQQAITLAERLHGPPTRQFGQSLIDITYIDTQDPMAIGEVQGKLHTHASSPVDMLDWISAVSSNNETASLEHWRSTPTTPWLLAAISFAQPSDAATPELIAAAKALPPSDPGYTAITYQRLRLQPRNATTRTELLTILPRIAKDENTSAINLFTALNAATAPTLNDWLAASGRQPATDSESSNDTGVTAPMVPIAPGAGTSLPENVCGHHPRVNEPHELFDTDAANALNRNFPLSLLATAAESTTLPENLRFQVAQAAWARALLLDSDGTNTTYQAIAHRMEPVLLACRATWKPVFDAYNAARTPEVRHAAALLALMRFASTEPSVRDGEERRNGFATYDNFRQNWWCTTVPPPGQTVDYWEVPNTDGSQNPAPTNTSVAYKLKPPILLTQTDLITAHAEVAALEKIPSASTYFAQQALAWYKLHPKDPTTPDILGEADRVLRNSCRKDPPYDQKSNQQIADPNDMTLTPNLAKAIFTVLHRDYPNSSWAIRYTTWE